MELREKHERIEEYEADFGGSLLVFDGYESTVSEFVLENTTVEKMVLRCLELSAWHPSVYENGEAQTRNDKWRSSLDIYRHIKYYYPEVTLPMVMGAIYNVREELVGHYCNDVNRRVFKLQKMTPRVAGYVLSLGQADEYGFSLSDWENL